MNQQLIEQYVAGRLGEAEAEAFEEFCLENPEFAKQVELEQRLKSGLAQVARGSTSEFVREHQGRWKLALAASVVLCVTAGIFIWQRSAAVHPHILAAVVTDTEQNAPAMRLALVRGAENVPVLPPGVVRVEIVGLFDPATNYSIVLNRLQADREVATVAALYGQQPSSAISLEVLLDGDQLASGRYSLHIAAKDSQDEPLELGFVKP